MRIIVDVTLCANDISAAEEVTAEAFKHGSLATKLKYFCYSNIYIWKFAEFRALSLSILYINDVDARAKFLNELFPRVAKKGVQRFFCP